MRLIGTVAKPVSPGRTSAFGVSGIRQAVFVQNRSSGRSSTSRSRTPVQRALPEH